MVKIPFILKNYIFFKITAAKYQQEILADFILQLHHNELEIGYVQQDGATAHSTNCGPI